MTGDVTMQTKSNTVKRLRWDIIFFFNTLVAAMFTLSGIAPVAATIARDLCFMFLTFFVLTLFGQFFQKALE
jgi:uncharacterized membrane protein YtjA (UPF0391 family)